MPLLSVFSVLLSSLELPLLKTFVALNGLLSIDVHCAVKKLLSGSLLAAVLV